MPAYVEVREFYVAGRRSRGYVKAAHNEGSPPEAEVWEARCSVGALGQPIAKRFEGERAHERALQWSAGVLEALDEHADAVDAADTKLRGAVRSLGNDEPEEGQ